MSKKITSAALLANAIPAAAVQTFYPEPFASMVAGRHKRRLGEAFDLTNFGINLCQLKPGAVSSVRHWHSLEDEFIYILSGTPTLITDQGMELLEPGMCAGFKAGSGDAHQLRNDSEQEVSYLEIGGRNQADMVVYPDDDLALQNDNGDYSFTRKNGDAYPAK